MYITYIKEIINIFTCFGTDLKPVPQYSNDSVTHERENTTQFAQHLYNTVLRAKRIGITRVNDVFTQLVAELNPFRASKSQKSPQHS